MASLRPATWCAARRFESFARTLPRRADAEAFVTPYVDGNGHLNARLQFGDLPRLFCDDFLMDTPEGNELWT